MKRFIFLLLFLGCLDAYSQKVAIRVNALSAYPIRKYDALLHNQIGMCQYVFHFQQVYP